MLALIAVANMPWYLYGGVEGTAFAHHVGATGGDAVWQAISIVAIDGRAYPLFAFLFGYGIWQLYSKQIAAGRDPREITRLLQRRHAWMIAFGAVHALLLWMGDIVGAYGLVGLLITWLFLDRPDRTLRIWVIGMASLLVLVGLLAGTGGVMLTLSGEPMESFSSGSAAGIESYPASMLARFGMWVVIALLQGLLSMVVPAAILVGILAARHRVLEEPGAHLPLLRRVAGAGVAIGWLGGGLSALTWFGMLPLALPDWTFVGVHFLTGFAGGLGYAALFALVAERVARRPLGPVSTALTATGARSLSAYLAQSVVMAPLFSAWGLGVGAWIGELAGAGIAIATWLVTVVLAALLDRSGRRGPAEWLLRRLAYGGRGRFGTPTAVSRVPVSTP